eukprot:TRINITY_DN13708_c0_g1_i2.p1 TRINITY_DN13708_c0_g1~~TRINITY_DN13708_c0_g1_i2.p1  ORF type:complete len:852 (-),score=171.11 TRINITY_DN13708_c0_g1_i2:10-2565(-)
MKQPMSKTQILEITNNDNTALSIDLKFEKKPYIDVNLNPGQVILPYTGNEGEKLKIPIVFTPRDMRKYEETINFDFNGIYKANIVVKGEGIPLLLELTKTEKQFLDFGVGKVSQEITKTATLINKSKRAVTFSIFPENPSEFEKACLSLNIEHEEEKTLKPNETFALEITYLPTNRMPAFKHDILLKVKENETRRLTTVSGVSHGIEVKFIEDVLSFGSVVKGSRLSKKLQLANFGDIDAQFSWDKTIYQKHFTIIPEKGHVLPHEDLYLEVIFHPQLPNDDIKYDKLACTITGGPPLFLTLIGKCVDQAKENTQDINFETEVRKPTKQTVNVENPTAVQWTIKPTISTQKDSCKNYFKGNSTLEIPPKSKGAYEITYYPLKMNVPEASEEAEKPPVDLHEASLFFPLPDGSAILYRLFGKATPPQPLDTIKDKAVAKKQKFISIPVTNWLEETQRFAVTWVIDKENTDPATFIRGANTFDVAGNSTKEYKLNFITYKEGNANFTITFKNESTKEYIFYNVELEVDPPETIATIELISVVRESVSKTISIENPLDTPVKIEKEQFEVDSEDIFITPESFSIPPQKENAIEINFRPLIVEDKEVTLTLTNPELGTFVYQLSLKGLKSTIQRSMHFKTSLGSELVQTFRFINYVKKATTYTVKLERISAGGAQGGAVTEFKSEPSSIAAQPAESHLGIELSVNVKYEPNNIGESRAIMLITNPEGVEYSCLLYGNGTAPQPQSITKIMHTKTVNIEFKNPLSEKCEFSIRFDNPCFTLATKLPGPIESGKGVSLPVKYDFSDSQPSTGRMIISTKDLPPWIYYLHGEKQISPCLLYTSPSPRDATLSRMPSSA